MSEPGYFVGVGVPKAGTTWLARYLFRHPDVLNHPIKELHVFDWLYARDYAVGTPGRARTYADSTRQRVRSMREEGPEPDPDEAAARQRFDFTIAFLERRIEAYDELAEIVADRDADRVMAAYRDYFARRLRPSTRAFGEITPSYALLPPEGYRRILDTFPSARVFLVLRDPVDRVAAAVRHHLRVHPGLEPDAVLDHELGHPGRLGRGDYLRTLDALEAVVPDDQLLVLFYEDLFDEQRGDQTLQRVTDHVGVPFRPPDRSVVVNPGGPWEPTPEQVARCFDVVGPLYDALPARGFDLPPGWRRPTNG